jgi:hypothetical protein
VEKVVQNCIDVKCLKIKADETCEAYTKPSLKWSVGPCPLSPKPKQEKVETKLNPIKKSKRRE